MKIILLIYQLITTVWSNVWFPFCNQLESLLHVRRGGVSGCGAPLRTGSSARLFHVFLPLFLHMSINCWSPQSAAHPPPNTLSGPSVFIMVLSVSHLPFPEVMTKKSVPICGIQENPRCVSSEKTKRIYHIVSTGCGEQSGVCPRAADIVEWRTEWKQAGMVIQINGSMWSVDSLELFS